MARTRTNWQNFPYRQAEKKLELLVRFTTTDANTTDAASSNLEPSNTVLYFDFRTSDHGDERHHNEGSLSTNQGASSERNLHSRIAEAITEDDIDLFRSHLMALSRQDLTIYQPTLLCETLHPNLGGHTMLMLASQAGAIKVLEYMLKISQLKLDTKGNNDWTALHSACWRGKHEVVCLLLRNGADIDPYSAAGSTPLCLAAMRGHVAIAKSLLNAGANVNGRGEEGDSSPLHLACTRNDIEMVEALLQRDPEVDPSSHTQLEAASIYGSKELVQALFEKSFRSHPVSAECLIDLHCKPRGEPIVGDVPYSDAGGKLVEIDYTRLQTRSRKVEDLHRSYASDSGFKHHSQALEHSCEILQENILRLSEHQNSLYDQSHVTSKSSREIGVRSNERDDVMRAAEALRHGLLTPTKQLIERQIDPRCLLSEIDLAYTTLFKGHFADCKLLPDAARQGKLNVVEYFLAYGFDPDEAERLGDAMGSTALHWASYAGDVEMIKLLLQHGAKVDAANALGTTPLLMAAEVGSVAAVQALLAAGAKVNGESRIADRTPLEKACTTATSTKSSDHDKVVEILIAEGADPNLESTPPLECARKFRSEKVVKMLLDAGARAEFTCDECRRDLALYCWATEQV